MSLTTKDALLERMVDATSAIKNNIQVMAPVGCVMAFAGSTTPDGWLLCDGSNVSRTTYAALFAVIGTTYGAGDGSTTFGLPNLADKFIQGNATVGTVKTAGLPNITGKFSVRGNASLAVAGNTSDNGAFNVVSSTALTNSAAANGSGTSNSKNVEFDASSSNSIYGNSTTVQPPAVTMRYIIKH